MITLETATRLALLDLWDALDSSDDRNVDHWAHTDKLIDRLAKDAVPHTTSDLLEFIEASAESYIRQQLRGLLDELESNADKQVQLSCRAGLNDDR